MFSRFDKVIANQKKQIRKISIKIAILYILISVCCFIASHQYNSWKFHDADVKGKALISGAMAIVFLITNGVTGFAVLHMRRTIKGMKNIYVKETLIIFHLINFVVYSMFYISYLGLVVAGWQVYGDYAKTNDNEILLTERKIFYYAYLIWLINEFVLLYNVIFLLALILAFTQKESEALVSDKMLNRGTPKLVCA